MSRNNHYYNVRQHTDLMYHMVLPCKLRHYTYHTHNLHHRMDHHQNPAVAEVVAEVVVVHLELHLMLHLMLHLIHLK